MAPPSNVTVDQLGLTMDRSTLWITVFPVLNSSLDGMETNVSSNFTDINMNKNILIPAAMFAVGVLGNVTALVILIIRPSKDSRSTAFYQLVKALATMDLFGIVALSPVTMCVYLMGGILNTGGAALCHYFSFMLVMAGNATLFIVLVMAVERFMVTKYPFQYQRIVTPLAVNGCILGVWALAAVIAVLPIFGLGRNSDRWPGTWCFFDYRSKNLGDYVYSFLYALIGLLIIIITIVLNVTVIQHLWRMRTSRLSSSIRSTKTISSGIQGNSLRRAPDSEKRMVIFLMAIIVVFTVCYAPFMVRILINQILKSGEVVPVGGVDDNLDLWTLRLASLNQILDPWVYIISRVTCCSGKRNDNDHVTSNCTQDVIIRQESNQCKEGRFHRSLQRFLTVFGKTKEGHKERENTTLLPLGTNKVAHDSNSLLKQNADGVNGTQM